MQAIEEVNELLTAKLCSPVIVYGVVLAISLVSIYFCRQKLQRYNTSKMENLYNLYTMQELKFMIILGVVMYGLCQYNKTELAWIFLIFPVIYVLIQNLLLYIHVSSAIQSAPQETPMQMQSYGLGMNAPLLQQQPQTGQGPSPPQVTSSPPPLSPQKTPTSEYTLPKLSNNSTSLNGGDIQGFSF